MNWTFFTFVMYALLKNIHKILGSGQVVDARLSDGFFRKCFLTAIAIVGESLFVGYILEKEILIFPIFFTPTSF